MGSRNVTQQNEDQEKVHARAQSMTYDEEKLNNETSPHRPHVSGPYYVPYLDNNKVRGMKELDSNGYMFENEADRKKREDLEYRKKIALELK